MTIRYFHKTGQKKKLPVDVKQILSLANYEPAPGVDDHAAVSKRLGYATLLLFGWDNCVHPCDQYNLNKNWYKDNISVLR